MLPQKLIIFDGGESYPSGYYPTDNSAVINGTHYAGNDGYLGFYIFGFDPSMNGKTVNIKVSSSGLLGFTDANFTVVGTGGNDLTGKPVSGYGFMLYGHWHPSGRNGTYTLTISYNDISQNYKVTVDI